MKIKKTLAVLIFASTILLGAGTHDQAEALLADHQCAFCHSLHGGPGYALLSAETSELVCLSCHTVSINDTAAAEVHNPLGLASNQSGYVTCRECHDAHSNQGGNIKLVGYRRDGENFFESFAYPAIRKELPATDGLNYNVVTFTGPNEFNIADPAILGPCEVCHTPYHNAGNDCTLCHGHSEGFPKPDCTASGCHDGTIGAGVPVARGVSLFSTHSTNAIAASKGITFTCGDCHSGHLSGNVQVPNNSLVGINYITEGHNGISLGSLAAPGETEAQICWNCHDLYGVSEWETNTQSSTGNSPYNYGTLSSSNWTTATWSSSHTEFAYKTGSIQSTHTANPTITDSTLTGLAYSHMESVNTVAAIRCSYCHDVHELAAAPNDTASGKPYLRGTWKGSPYEEDGAPRSIYAGTAYFPSVSQTNQAGKTAGWGAVPRAHPSQRYLGGYWVDENNVVPMSATTTSNGTPALNPTSAWTTADFAGLCFLCHMNGQATTAGKVDNMDQKTGEALWLGTNGHANAVKGGTGATSPNAFNLFGVRGATTWFDNNPPMNYADFIQDSTTYGCAGRQQGTIVAGNGPGESCDLGFRGSLGFGYDPAISPNQNFLWNSYLWGVTVDSSTTDSYHQFSCSKCHNPHASRLPKLMITNCLDTKHNTWDNQFQLNTSGGTNNQNTELSQWTSSQNCHRLARINPNPANTSEYRSGSSAGVGEGWNKATPWTSTTETE